MEKQVVQSISIIIPVFNEEPNIPVLHEELMKVMITNKYDYEVIYIDDGSVDNSFEVLKKISYADGGIKVIKLTRNFGKSAALAAGLEHVTKEIIVTLDADLQNDPNDIPALLKEIENGFDLVSGWRRRRKDVWLTRKLPSVIANKIISVVTGVPIHDFGCMLKVYKRKFLGTIKLYGEMHRLIPAYLHAYGAKITEIVVNHRPRMFGKSKYGLSRTFKVIMDLITTKFMLVYFSKPSYVIGGWGVILFIFGCIAGAIVLYNKFVFGIFAHKQPMLLLAVFLGILGTQFIAFGLLAELVVRIYYSSEHHKEYMIETFINNKTIISDKDYEKTMKL